MPAFWHGFRVIGNIFLGGETDHQAKIFLISLIHQKLIGKLATFTQNFLP